MYSWAVDLERILVAAKLWSTNGSRRVIVTNIFNRWGASREVTANLCNFVELGLQRLQTAIQEYSASTLVPPYKRWKYAPKLKIVYGEPEKPKRSTAGQEENRLKAVTDILSFVLNSRSGDGKFDVSLLQPWDNLLPLQFCDNDSNMRYVNPHIQYSRMFVMGAWLHYFLNYV